MKSDRANRLIDAERRDRRERIVLAFLIGLAVGVLLTLTFLDVQAVW